MPVGCRLQRPGMRRLLLAPNVERRSKAARSARPQSRLALAESLLAPPAAGPESRASMPETTTARAGKANRIESRCHCDTTHKGPGNQPGLPAGGGRGDAPPNLHREPAPSNMQPVRPRGRQDLLFFLCRFIFFSFCFGFVLWLWRVSLSELEAFLSGFLASYSPRVVYFFFFFSRCCRLWLFTKTNLLQRKLDFRRQSHVPLACRASCSGKIGAPSTAGDTQPRRVSASTLPHPERGTTISLLGLIVVFKPLIFLCRVTLS